MLTDETPKDNERQRTSVPIPFLGSITLNYLTTSQGYRVTVNDMHGKQKKASNFRQLKTGEFEPDAFTFVEYKYRSEQITHRGRKVNAPGERVQRKRGRPFGGSDGSRRHQQPGKHSVHETGNGILP